MNEDKILRELQRIPLNDYLQICREHGRQSIPESVRTDACNLYSLVTEWRTTTKSLSLEILSALELAENFLSAEYFLRNNPLPRYTAYTNIRVLDCFLHVGHQIPLTASLDRCTTAIALLVRDWREYETNALMMYPDRYNKLNFDIDSVRERIAGLDEFAKLTRKKGLPDVHSIDAIPTHTYRSDWIYYAIEASGALALCHITCLPQSKFHDEYMFLRTIHIAECCFHGINLSVRAAIFLAKDGSIDEAIDCLKHANLFASFLVKLFALFPTMPIKSFFDGFRLSTGNASAIQSEKYQLLEKITRGLSERKKVALSKQIEGHFYSDWNLPEEFTLAGLIESLEDNGRGSIQILGSLISELDRLLLMWRSKHLGIARKYLPAEAKGTGDEGVSYLEGNVREPTIKDETMFEDTVDGSRLALTAALQIAARNTAFHWCELNNINTRDLYENLKNIRHITNDTVSNPSHEVQEAIEIYDRFFSDHQHSSPLTGQLAMCKAKGVPDRNPIAELLLTCEIQSGVLIGIHNIERISGALRLDVAIDGDSYEHIGKKTQRCRSGDWIIRDGKGIIASYFDGPDKRTALDVEAFETGKILTSIGVIILGAPELAPERINHAINLINELIGKFSEKYRWWTWRI